jgi:hypothetical protein
MLRLKKFLKKEKKKEGEIMKKYILMIVNLLSCFLFAGCNIFSIGEVKLPASYGIGTTVKANAFDISFVSKIDYDLFFYFHITNEKLISQDMYDIMEISFDNSHPYIYEVFIDGESTIIRDKTKTDFTLKIALANDFVDENNYSHQYFKIWSISFWF